MYINAGSLFISAARRTRKSDTAQTLLYLERRLELRRLATTGFLRTTIRIRRLRRSLFRPAQHAIPPPMLHCSWVALSRSLVTSVTGL